MIKLLSIRASFLEREMEQHSRDYGVKVFFTPFSKNKKLAINTPKLYKKFKDIQPDVFVFWKDPHLTPKILTKLKNISCKTKFVMWYGDQRGYIVPPLIQERKGLLDCLLLTNNDSKQFNIYRKFGIPCVRNFYHSFSTEEFKLFDHVPAYDVFFGGSNFNPKKFPLSRLRFKLINAINKRFNLGVRGGGWNFKTKKWVLRPVYAHALRSAKITFGINHYDIVRYYNRRLFESVASGRMHLTYYIPGMEKDFKNREHLVWFKSIKECVSLIDYYLKNTKEREAIAKQGRNFFIKKHSWPIRAKQFVNIMQKLV